jgi:hypothetical protein
MVKRKDDDFLANAKEMALLLHRRITEDPDNAVPSEIRGCAELSLKIHQTHTKEREFDEQPSAFEIIQKEALNGGKTDKRKRNKLAEHFAELNASSTSGNTGDGEISGS